MNMHINAKKVQFAQTRVLFLGHDIQHDTYGLSTYIFEQSKKLPEMSSKQEIK